MRRELEETVSRKLEHMLLALSEDVEEGETLLDEVVFVHNPLPEIDLRGVDLRIEFLGRELDAPIVVEGVTGGHPLSVEVNRRLARLARRHKLAVEMGSQRALMEAGENEEILRSYRVLREEAGEAPVIGNIGVQQLPDEDPADAANRLVEAVDADALAVHLNPAQEVFQPEGDALYSGALEKVRRLARSLKVPLIVKETGCGVSFEAARMLRDAGVSYIDVAGRGGTSWIKIEMLRCKRRGDEVLAGAAKSFLSWGIPTAASIVEVKAAHPQAFVIGSGGIRSGLHAAAAMRLGAGAVGMALPLFRLALRSEESLDAYVERFKAELRRALFLTGSRNFEELRRAPIVLGPRLLSWFQQRIPGWQALLRLPIT